jgi:energy-coupling factor transporter ATP-binding protein EcfA2
MTSEEIAGRIQKFRLLTVAHPMLSTAKDLLVAAINEAPPGTIVMVFGPTGVGKTTLRLKIQQVLTEQGGPFMKTDPGGLPYVAVEAAAPDNGNFNWRDHYRRTLVELSEPMLDSKLKPKWIHFAHDSQGQQFVRPDASAAQLRQALESAVQHRRPAAILIDEAQHLTRMASGRRLADQLEVIKSLANCTRTVHILLGTYDLLAFRHLNGQLSRRSLDIHFRRYSAENRDDIHVFKSTVLTFQRHLPLEDQPDLLPLWEWLYERSVGCIGILKEWLDRALIVALGEGCKTLTARHLETTALSAARCEKIALEALEGERQLLSADQARPRLRELLGLEGSAAGSATEATARRTPHLRSRVGQRKPKRDPIGQPAGLSRTACHGV